jgi:hypothetical protein
VIWSRASRIGGRGLRATKAGAVERATAQGRASHIPGSAVQSTLTGSQDSLTPARHRSTRWSRVEYCHFTGLFRIYRLQSLLRRPQI